uniref:F-box domain-containing protein n=1 Tax=Timema monikensis TaxID=170555 RepID=A0A7R9E870_9NEOP|nr:unnamed protein product [Timema monikensis]
MKHCGSWETANFTVNNATKVNSPECRRTKRMKMNDADESKMNNGLDRWSGNSDVEPDLLEDMGLSILDDKSENRPDNFPPLVSGLRPCNALKKTCVTGVNSKEAVVDYFDSQMTQENIPTPESFFIFRRKKPTADDAFSKLSDEMVLTIFRHMPKKSLVRCAFVCKRWRRIAYDESLWSRLDLSLRTLRPGNLGYTLVRGVSILRLAQAEVSDPVFECASPLVTKEYDCKLQYLDLSMAVISKRGLADLLKCCRHLRKLSIEHCTVNKDICAAISLNSNLEVLNLSACYGLTEDSINTIITGCRK